MQYYDFLYQAKSWDRARRVVAKVEWRRGELLPRWGISPNLCRRSPLTTSSAVSLG